MGQAFELEQRIEKGFIRQANRAAQGQGGKRIGGVVQAGDFQFGCLHQVGTPFHQPKFPLDVAQPPVAFFPGLIQSKGENLTSGSDHAARPVVLPVHHLDAVAKEDARLRVRVVAHAGVTVEVILAQVQDSGSIRIQSARRLKLETRQLQYEHVRTAPGSRIHFQQCFEDRQSDVARNQRPDLGGTNHRADHFRHCTFAVRSGDGNHPVAWKFAPYPGEQLDVAGDIDAFVHRGTHQRLGQWHAGTDGDEVHIGETFGAKRSGAQFHGRKLVLKLLRERRCLATVRDTHRGAAGIEPARHRHSACAETEHQRMLICQIDRHASPSLQTRFATTAPNRRLQFHS